MNVNGLVMIASQLGWLSGYKCIGGGILYQKLLLLVDEGRLSG